jgi:hypothetical protein
MQKNLEQFQSSLHLFTHPVVTILRQFNGGVAPVDVLYDIIGLFMRNDYSRKDSNLKPVRAFMQAGLLSTALLLDACSGGGGASNGFTPASQASTLSDTTGITRVTDATSVSTIPAVSFDATSKGNTIYANQFGANLSSYTNIDITQPYHLQNLQSMGAHLIRWPGGGVADTYHWQNNTSCSGVGANDTFPNFLNSIIKPGNLDFAIAVNYGTNATCNGPGDPAEAAAWVAYAKTQGYTAKHWTVGNEVYGSWETDMHSAAHDPATYVTALNNSYYPQIKAADSTALVGAVVSGYLTSWDSYVIAHGKYDFLEVHWYAQNGNDADTTLLKAPGNIAGVVSTLRSSLSSAGKASTPIYFGEFNSEGTYTNLNKQSVSIVNGLFAGQTLAELMKNGVQMASWWSADTEGNNPDTGSSVYGFQNFGTYSAASSTGTLYPSARAYQLAEQFGAVGSHMLTTTVPSTLPNVRVYAATQGKGYALFIFNLSETATQTFNLSVVHSSRSTFAGSTLTYGKAQYDNSQTNVWTPPVSATLANVTTTQKVTLPVWSMTVLKML